MSEELRLPDGPVGSGGGRRRGQGYNAELHALEGDQFLKVPAKPSKAGVELDVSGIKHAIRVFGIKEPVKVKWTNSGLGSSKHWGTHFFEDGCHLIHVSTYWPADQVSSTMWHELVHARQTEQYATPHEFAMEYKREQRSVGYKRNCFEVEANQVAKEQNAVRPLARKGR